MKMTYTGPHLFHNLVGLQRAIAALVGLAGAWSWGLAFPQNDFQGRSDLQGHYQLFWWKLGTLLLFWGLHGCTMYYIVLPCKPNESGYLEHFGYRKPNLTLRREHVIMIWSEQTYGTLLRYSQLKMFWFTSKIRRTKFIETISNHILNIPEQNWSVKFGTWSIFQQNLGIYNHPNWLNWLSYFSEG